MRILDKLLGCNKKVVRELSDNFYIVRGQLTPDDCGFYELYEKRRFLWSKYYGWSTKEEHLVNYHASIIRNREYYSEWYGDE